jgi:hypothetical protein
VLLPLFTPVSEDIVPIVEEPVIYLLLVMSGTKPVNIAPDPTATPSVLWYPSSDTTPLSGTSGGTITVPPFAASVLVPTIGNTVPNGTLPSNWPTVNLFLIDTPPSNIPAPVVDETESVVPFTNKLL